MSWRVEQVGDARTWADFLELPGRLYRDDPNWVPPLGAEVRRTLDPGSNPYFAQARRAVFICYRDDLPVARVCAVINPAHWVRFGARTAFFGFFEASNDVEASGRLFDAAERFCHEEGAQSVEGPYNPNHYSELGLQTSGFGCPPVFFESYNPAYYASLLEQVGFVVERRLHTRHNPEIGAYLRRRYGCLARPSGRGEFRVRPFRLLEMRQELERIRSVYNDAFGDNWQFLPLSSAEYSFAARYLLLLTSPRWVALVEHCGEPVAVAQCAFDVNPVLRRLRGRGGLGAVARLLGGRGAIRDIVLYAIGVKSDFRQSDAYRLLLNYLFWVLRDSRVMTTTWMTEDNLAALNGARRFGLEPSKYFCIYGKRL